MIFYIILLYFHWYGHFVIDGYFDISFYLKKYLSYLVPLSVIFLLLEIQIR